MLRSNLQQESQFPLNLSADLLLEGLSIIYDGGSTIRQPVEISRDTSPSIQSSSNQGL
jgi:hypothetical protein